MPFALNMTKWSMKCGIEICSRRNLNYNVCSFWGDFAIVSLTSIQEQCIYIDQRGLPQSVLQAAAQRCENQIEVRLNNSIILQHSLLSQIYHVGGIYYSHLDCIVCVRNPFLLMPFCSPLFTESFMRQTWLSLLYILLLFHWTYCYCYIIVILTKWLLNHIRAVFMA